MVVKEDRFGYKIFVGAKRMEIRVCYDDRVYNSSNWTPDPMVTTVPMLYNQIIIQLTLSSIIFLLLLPLNQSRLVAEVIVSILSILWQLPVKIN